MKIRIILLMMASLLMTRSVMGEPARPHVELMEPNTVDGLTAPFSTAPPPR